MNPASRTSFIVVFLLLVVLAAAGCGRKGDGPEMAEVAGTVRLDGQPLPDATVIFAPAAAGGGMNSGGTSIGRTDAEGKYRLEYTQSKSGAVVGKHTVQISTGAEENEDEDGNTVPAVKEKVPAKYNINSELIKDVSAGNNTIDFDLKST